MLSLHLHDADAHYTCLNSINENTLEWLAKISRVWNKCVWVDGIREKDTLSNVIHIFSYSSIIYWLCQESITPPQLIQGFWERPLAQSLPGNWKSSSLPFSVSLNYWTSPNVPPLFLLLLYSAFTQLQVSVLSQQILQFNEESPLEECLSVQDAFGSRTVKMWGGHVSVDVDSQFVCCAFFIVHHCLSESECDWASKHLINIVTRSSGHFHLFLLASHL